MNRRQFNTFLKTFRQLRRRKYPMFIIVGIIFTSFLFQTFQISSQDFSLDSSSECKVLKVYDGDTITVQCPNEPKKTRIRFHCIDTPEMRQEPWGEQARDYLRSITGDVIHLVKIDKDRYGRIVGEVYNSDNINLNLAQVEAGQAAVYNRYCEKDEYIEAEERAKQAELGIWSTPGLHQTPWKWRQEQRKNK
ncbi:MAG: thermonuclease family protein [Thiomargarita sp.]|nr:thermonuclease family protein [Thiomargarita sp.]